MIANGDLKRYNKKNEYSYSFGTFPTLELLANRPESVEKVFLHSDAKDEIRKKAREACQKAGVSLMENDRLLERIREKDNCLILGVFRKYAGTLVHGADHVVLVNPSDMGNLGTIIRSCAGFGISNLALVEPAADTFHPKVVRASMGSLFRMQIQRFSDFSEYEREYGEERDCYPFMLKGAKRLGTVTPGQGRPFSLIFGNESSGLDDSFLKVGQSILISHSADIDSLNLSLAAGIALYEFTKRDFLRP